MLQKIFFTLFLKIYFVSSFFILKKYQHQKACKLMSNVCRDHLCGSVYPSMPGMGVLYFISDFSLSLFAHGPGCTACLCIGGYVVLLSLLFTIGYQIDLSCLLSLETHFTKDLFRLS